MCGGTTVVRVDTLVLPASIPEETRMNVLSRRDFTIAVLTLACATAAAAADPFPVKPIRIVVTSAAGGLVDITTRAISQKMMEKLGQPVVVENRAGAGGLVGIRGVKTAPADGYTLLAI